MAEAKATKVQVTPVKSSSHSVLSSQSSASSSSNIKTAVVQQNLPQTGFHIDEPIVPLTLAVGGLVVLLGIKHYLNKRSDR